MGRGKSFVTPSRTSRELTLRGGPFDGAVVRPSSATTFGFVGPDGKVYREAKPGRILYRRSGNATMDYAERTHTRCEGCGAFHLKVRLRIVGSEPLDLTESCSLCGGTLA